MSDKSAVTRAQQAASDAALNAYLQRSRRPLRTLAVLLEQRKDGRWSAEVLTRDAFLERVDARSRDAEHERDREVCKDLAAWIRAQSLCVEVIVWADGTMARGTIEHERRGPPRRLPVGCA